MRKDAVVLTKVVDETAHVSCAAGNGIIREEVWQDAKGRVVKYNLAFVNRHLSPGDNGRVLGYDNGHEGHHRHYLGKVTRYDFRSYEELLSEFLKEVGRLRAMKRGEEL